MNQLEKDLRRQVRRKLEMWVQDSFDLFEMAELSPLSAAAVIVESLMKTTATMIAGLTQMTGNEVGQMLYDLVEAKRRDIAEAEAEQKKTSRS